MAGKRGNGEGSIYQRLDGYYCAALTLEGGKRLATVLLSPGEFGWPMVAPPAVPADRAQALRGAFNKSMADPELIAEAKKRLLDLAPSTGEELEALAKEVIAQPPAVVERMKKLLEN